jgi:UDP-GlcNAc:undecaprenyl-phosphate GlcNAc-1-phosphate transferase
VWRYISFGDALRFFIAILAGGSLSSLVVRWVYTYPDQPNTVFILYGILMLFLMIASRFSFRLLERVTQVIQQQDDTRILIYGAGEGGTLALRECQQNLDLGFKPIGFLDDDPLKKRRSIYDLTVLGSLDDLDRLIDRHNVQGIIIASVDIVESGAAEKAIRICKQKDVWVRRMRLEFDSLT